MSGPFGAGGLGFFGTAEFYEYLLKRSLHFNNEGSTGEDATASRLRFEPTTTGSNTDWTISFWIKRNSLGTIQDIIDVGAGDGTGGSGSSDANTDTIQFQSDDTIRIQNNGSAILHTNAKFRDTTAWYNIVVKSDADNSDVDEFGNANANRLKVYINGVDQDDSASGGGGFSTDNRSGLSSWSEIGSTDPIQIGARIYNNGNNLDAYLAEFHYVDGTALTASSFGEIKEGIWIPKDYTGTHGTNGFYLDFTDDTTVAGFSAVTYTGPIPASAAAGTTGTVSGVGFSPDFVWIKNRTFSLGSNHQLFDVVRGIDSSGDQALHTNTKDAQSTTNSNGGVSSIDSDGFTVKAGTDTGTGRSRLTGSDADNYVSWNWQAGGAPTTDNSAGQGNVPTAGSVKINGSNSSSALSGSLVAKKISANTTYGFSIVKWTGVGEGAATIDHGLGVAPKFIITKHINDNTYNWNCFHQGIDASSPEDFFIALNPDTNGSPRGRQELSAADCWNQTLPTNTVFSVKSEATAGENGEDMLAYCFAEISGYSSIGSYTGNGSSTGPTITTGFDVGWLLIKKTHTVSSGATASGTSWVVLDRARDAATQGRTPLFAGETAVEVDSPNVTFTSTGFQIITASTAVNTSGDNYIYVAIKNTRTNAFYFDQSGNGNHPSATGLEYTDSKPDLPTNNFCVVNSLSDVSDIVLSNGNLTLTSTTDSWPTVRGTMGVPSGKWYYEVISTDTTRWGAGWATSEFQTGSSFSNTISDAILAYSTDPLGVLDFGTSRSINGSPAFSASTPQNNILQVAIDIDAGKFWLGINNTYVNNSSGSAGNPSAGTNELETFTAGTEMFPAFINNSGNLTINFGQDSTFGNLRTAGGNSDVNGNGDFFYAPPTDFLALCSDNLPDPAIDPAADENPEDYFNTVLYTGNGSSNRGITGVGFSPNFIWIKDRLVSNNHILVDSVRGVSNLLYTNSNVKEVSGATQVASLDADGFTLGTSTTYVNETSSSNIYVAWNWKAGGTAVSNGNGSITSSVSASPESGFSIVSYTGTGSAATVGHGLGKVPAWIIIKNRGTGAREWVIYHHQSEGVPQNFGMFFGASPSVQPFDDDSSFNDTAPTADVFSVKDSASTNNTGEGHIAYCFAEIEGYSKFGRYSGTGGSDNSFVYLGFRPAWFLLKRVNSTGDWVLYDNKRNPFNPGDSRLSANLAAGRLDGAVNYGIDFVSNGVKFRSGQADTAVSGGTYIYMAFAEQPFKYANAR